MQAVFEKIIEKLEILQKDKYVKSPIMCHALEKSIEIVKQAVTEYNNGWIPCSERLPEESLNSVIGWDEYRKRCCLVQYYGGRWILDNDIDTVKIIAWMPLPDSFKPKGE